MQLNNWNAVCPSCGTAVPDIPAEQSAIHAGQVKSQVVSRTDMMLYKLIGIAGIIGGMLLLVMLVRNLVMMSHWGISPGDVARSALFGLLTPVLLFMGGGAALFLTERPGYGAAGGLISGTFLVGAIWGIIVFPVIIVRYIGAEALFGYNFISMLRSYPILLFIGLILLISRKFDESSRGRFVFCITAIGVFLGVAMLFLLTVLGRLLQIPSEIFYIFTNYGRWYCFCIPLLAFDLALNAILLSSNIRAYIVLTIAQLIIAVPIAFVFVVPMGFGVMGVVLAVIISEFIRAAISGLIVIREGRSA
jgi:hypothetical protein